MPSPKHTLRKRWAPALALLGTLAAPGLAATAVPLLAGIGLEFYLVATLIEPPASELDEPAWVGAIVGEFVAGFSEGAAGLGIRILESYRLLRTDLLFAYVFCACILGLTLFGCTNLLGYRLMRRWHPSEKG